MRRGKEEAGAVGTCSPFSLVQSMVWTHSADPLPHHICHTFHR
jgi:hypothetical protein